MEISSATIFAIMLRDKLFSFIHKPEGAARFTEEASRDVVASDAGSGLSTARTIEGVEARCYLMRANGTGAR
jgi:hypothetical protein